MRYNMSTKKLILISTSLVCLAITEQTIIKLTAPPKEILYFDTAATKINWNKIVETHLKDFSEDYILEEDTFGYTIRTYTQKMFGGVYFREFWDSYGEIVKPFYKSELIRISFYQWVKPYYIDAFKKLPQWKKEM